ncbi:MAG: hypothetical protein KDA24_15990 [Deltaproteobacteria bacterium]|nr:hypothetical protein [Deltaproteobacteria bacterium]
MAKPIVVTFEGEESAFSIQKVSRSRLYGSRQRVPLDPTGSRCRRAALTDDGSLLLLQGMTAQGYFDTKGAWVPNNTLVGITPDGEEADKVSSTLGVPQELQGPVDPTVVLDLSVNSIYSLEPEEVSEGLTARLASGEIFTFRFAYRTGYNVDVGVLVGNDNGLFALVGRSRPSEWNELEQLVQPLLEEDEDDLDDDLDFEMF